MTPRRAPRALVLALGVSFLLSSLLGAWREAARLDRLESHRALGPAAVSAWSARPDGQHGLPMGGPSQVASRGVVRVRACAAGDAVPELLLEVTEASTRRVLGRERLTRDEALSRRCVTGEWRTGAARRVETALVSKSSPVALASLDLREGGAIDPRDFWPALMMVLGVGLLVLAPKLSRGRDEETSREFPPDDASPPAVRGYAGLALAVGALAVANALAQVPVLRGGLRGVTMLASLAVQQSMLALSAAAMLGAFTAPSARVAVELTAPPAGWLRRALVTASTLLALAVGVSLLLKDAGESPLARAVESMPTRYVIALGAVCAPLPEELFFRGLLGRLVGSIAGERRPVPIIAVSALLFTVMHAMQLEGARLGLVPIAALGLANGWLRWSTRGLVAPWAVHTFYNGVLALSALA